VRFGGCDPRSGRTLRGTVVERFVRFEIVQFPGFAEDDIVTQRSGTSSRGIQSTDILGEDRLFVA